MRRGISLLEVLVSIFILLFGLLGIAAMFPIGQYHVTSTLTHDRASEIADAAFAEIKLRDLLDSSKWQAVAPSTSVNPPVAFDPLGVGELPNGLKRVTRAGFQPNQAGDYLMRARSDLVTVQPSDSGAPVEARFGPGGHRGYEGAYSWMFTVTPHLVTPTDLSGLHNVSVVVFHRRTPADPDDPQGRAQSWVKPSANTYARPLPGALRLEFKFDVEELKRMKVDNWALISMNSSVQPWAWYRVEAFSEKRENDGSYQGNYQVMFSGPDPPWNDLYKPDFNPFKAPQFTVTFFSDVVAVHQQTVRRLGPDAWSWESP